MAVLLAVTVSACAPSRDPLSPPDIGYGQDVCDRCGMIISDERFAAAMIVRTPSGTQARKFDDVGEMLAYGAENPQFEVVRRYVHDYVSLEWIMADSATFVRSSGLATPMGYGLVAFADASAADALAREIDGQVLTFDALRTALGTTSD
jgi:copper chaperone NosL